MCERNYLSALFVALMMMIASRWLTKERSMQMGGDRVSFMSSICIFRKEGGVSTREVIRQERLAPTTNRQRAIPQRKLRNALWRQEIKIEP